MMRELHTLQIYLDNQIKLALEEEVLLPYVYGGKTQFSIFVVVWP